jgi:hypothetical protein
VEEAALGLPDSFLDYLRVSTCNASNKLRTKYSALKFKSIPREDKQVEDRFSRGHKWMPNFSLNFTVQKEDSSSHQNVGTCMEY